MAIDDDFAHLLRFLSKGDGAVVCSFFGHKDVPQSVCLKIRESIVYLITQRNVDCFLVGNQGGFDSMVLKVLRELKQLYPHICYNVVLAYMPTQKAEHERYDPKETCLPEGMESVPKQFAISWRNKWMVRQSQIIVCYIAHTWGGAAKSVEYAQSAGKEIINLFAGDQSQHHGGSL